VRGAISDDRPYRDLKIPRLGNPSVSETWSLAKIVRKVEFKLLHDSCQARACCVPR